VFFCGFGMISSDDGHTNILDSERNSEQQSMLGVSTVVCGLVGVVWTRLDKAAGKDRGLY